MKYFKPKYLTLLTLFVPVLYLWTILNNLQSTSDTEASPMYPLNANMTILKRYGIDDVVNYNGSLRHFIPNSLKLIDWHDYKQISFDLSKTGIGEQGRAVKLPQSKNGVSVNTLISLTRSLPDIRHPACAEKLYIESLPTVSVVVPFHNEHWHTLLRTASSVIYRSPPQLIKEVLLVDDGSTIQRLKSELKEWLAKNLPKARVIRLKEKRQGLITARLAGAKEATGDVIVFLDAHTEPNVNWLPPLLDPIAKDYRTVVCPFIDCIDGGTFAYSAQDEGARGAFDWQFHYKRLELLPVDKANMPDPFESPVMAGGLFAISRAFFWELGGYDPGLKIWGAEQYELSFKIWQCGGRMIDAPCSRVGHVYAGPHSPKMDPVLNDDNFLCRNYRRVAEVWMDEYASFLYARHRNCLKVDPGDLTEQKAVRQRLQCKPFHWFMTQIAFDLVKKYPEVEPDPVAEGRVRPLSDPRWCVDANHGEEGATLKLQACDNSSDTEQYWLVAGYSKDVSLKHRNVCWDVVKHDRKAPVYLYGCHKGRGNQEWSYKPGAKTMSFSKNDLCLEWDVTSRALFVNECFEDELSQEWLVDTVNNLTTVKQNK